jgi:hypothetical protein
VHVAQRRLALADKTGRTWRLVAETLLIQRGRQLINHAQVLNLDVVTTQSQTLANFLSAAQCSIILAELGIQRHLFQVPAITVRLHGLSAGK